MAHTKATPTREKKAHAALALDDLTRMDAGELEALFREAVVPDSLAALDGSPHGRMLAMAGPAGKGATAAYLRGLAAWARFPWRGKNFQSEGGERGAGINRVELAGSRSWYRFETRFDPSAIDGKPCVLLDYDNPDNPWYIRKIRDELRQVAPGLFLGPAMVVILGKPRLVLYFAIDHNTPDHA